MKLDFIISIPEWVIYLFVIWGVLATISNLISIIEKLRK